MEDGEQVIETRISSDEVMIKVINPEPGVAQRLLAALASGHAPGIPAAFLASGGERQRSPRKSLQETIRLAEEEFGQALLDGGEVPLSTTVRTVLSTGGDNLQKVMEHLRGIKEGTITPAALATEAG